MFEVVLVGGGGSERGGGNLTVEVVNGNLVRWNGVGLGNQLDGIVVQPYATL